MENELANITLPNTTIVNLYSKHLVILDDANTNTKKVIEPTIENKTNELFFLGDNKKNIAICINDETATHLRNEWLQLLTNILAACKLNIGDVAIINLNKQSATFLQLKEKINPAYCILFGVKTNMLDLSFIIPDYKIQQHNACSFVIAPSLSLMEGNTQEAKLEKSKLWLSLKQMFNL
ncbi:MAG: hypothetical protein JST94_09925 [Bacteroidetes bacterium]|nr:hypothetical protein [Bacteroidota bacterium]MBS1671753.1 hypothetical protein [Bacteroidota bacterium]